MFVLTESLVVWNNTERKYYIKNTLWCSQIPKIKFKALDVLYKNWLQLLQTSIPVRLFTITKSKMHSCNAYCFNEFFFFPNHFKSLSLVWLMVFDCHQVVWPKRNFLVQIFSLFTNKRKNKQQGMKCQHFPCNYWFLSENVISLQGQKSMILERSLPVITFNPPTH